MYSERNIFLIVMLIGVVFVPVPTLAQFDDENEELIKEFSRDHQRASALEQSKNLEGFVKLADEIEKQWPQKDMPMYGALMMHTIKAWMTAFGTVRKQPPMDIIRQHAAHALSTYDPNKPDADNISIESELGFVCKLHAQYVYTKDGFSNQEWVSSRRKGVERFLHAWRRLEKAIDKNWNPNEFLSMQVIPPEGAGIAPGMPPERIKDPVIRARYEQAIKEHREKLKYRHEQRELRKIKKRYYGVIERYLVSTYSIPPFDNDELKQFLNKNVEDKIIRNRIVRYVKNNIEKQTKDTPEGPQPQNQ